MHLAVTLKKLLTILLLIVLAVQASDHFSVESYEVSYAQETDEKGDKSGEEKKEKEYLPVPSLVTLFITDRKIFSPHGSILGLHPVLDHLSPPPDNKF